MNHHDDQVVGINDKSRAQLAPWTRHSDGVGYLWLHLVGYSSRLYGFVVGWVSMVICSSVDSVYFKSILIILMLIVHI